MNEEQIVLSLISLYKKEGIDLHQLLDEPLFNGLPVQKKVELIKQYAKQIHDGIHVGFSGRERRQLGKDIFFRSLMGAMTGAAASTAMAVKYGTPGTRSARAIALASAVGFGTGVGLGGLKAFDAYTEKRKIKDYFGATAANPTDEAAIQTIAIRNMQKRDSSETTAYNKFLDKIDAASEERAKKIATRETDEHNARAGRLLDFDSRNK